MIRLTPVRMMVIGVGMMVYASAISFVMALRWIPSTLFLNLTASMGSIVGLTLGLYGMFQKTHPRER